MAHPPDHHDLLAGAALDALDCSEQNQLQSLIEAHEGAALDDIEALEHVAGAAALGFSLGDAAFAQPPQRLSASLETLAAAWAQHRAAGSSVTASPAADDQAASVVGSIGRSAGFDSASTSDDEPRREDAGTTASGGPPRSIVPALGWLAAAACLALAAGVWLSRPAMLTGVATDPAQARQQLIASAGDNLVRWGWTATEDPAAAGATGDVVWDPQTQQGYMLFEGLAANNPTEAQYQLWIFDQTRQPGTPLLEQLPVDGGVFNVQADGTAVVPIRAKLPVGQPGAFAVTIEEPGGVVVSSRERLPLLAAPPSAG